MRRVLILVPMLMSAGASATEPVVPSESTPAIETDVSGVLGATRPLPPPITPARRAIAGPEYGMNVFIYENPATTERDLAKLTEAGFGWQKSLFQWGRIERQQGVFDWYEADLVVAASQRAGLQVLARVDYAPEWARSGTGVNAPPDRFEDFGNFVYQLADRYKPGSDRGSIAAIEVWNEPNIHSQWGGASIDPGAALDYVRLLCTTYEAVSRASPEMVVVTAGLAPNGLQGGPAAADTLYLRWMYDAGAAPCFDALGAHGAGFKAPPWVGPDELANDESFGGHPSFGFRRVEQLRAEMVRRGDEAKQIWLTEFGWTSDPMHSSYAWHAVTEGEKAEYVVEAYRWALFNWQPWIGVMAVWNLPSPDWTAEREEYWWAIANPDGSSRAAYDALRDARWSGYLP